MMLEKGLLFFSPTYMLPEYKAKINSYIALN